MRRIAKLVVSAAVFAVTWSIRSIRKLLGLPVRATAVVLYYHSVGDEERERFAAQMDQLLRNCEPIPADFDGGLEPGHRYVAVTFDDGLESVLKNGLPELAKRRIPSTVFIIADALGRRANWVEYRRDTENREWVISAEQVRELASNSVTIGSHTLTHPRLIAVETEIAKKEIAESRLKLQQLLKRDVRLFSFPYGEFNEQLVELCMSAGYTRAFAHFPKLAFSEPREFLTSRVRTDPSDWPVEFRLKLLGAYSWQPLTVPWKRKVRKPVCREMVSVEYGD